MSYLTIVLLEVLMWIMFASGTAWFIQLRFIDKIGTKKAITNSLIVAGVAALALFVLQFVTPVR